MRPAESARSEAAPARGSVARVKLLGRGIAAALVAVLVVLGLILPIYWVYLLSAVAIGALIARGIGVVTNRAGLILLCQMSFAAIGGWVVSWIALVALGVPFPLLVLVGGVVAAPLGWLLGFVTARIRGVELAVVTLGFAAALDLVLRQGAFPGVGSGTPVMPTAPFDDPRWFFALAWAVLLVLQFAVALISRSGFGIAWAAIRAGDRVAAALGVHVAGSKAGAFGTGALFAGCAGGLLAGQYGLLTPSVFTPLTSMVHLATAVLCGASLFAGAVLSGVFAVFVPEVLRRVGLPIDVANALLALGAFDVLRRGNGGIAEQLRDRLQDRAFRGARLGCALEPGGGTVVGAVAAPAEPVRTEPTRSETTHSEPVSRPSSGAAEPPLLTVAGLTVCLGGTRVLDGVDLTVQAGEVHALIGPNGAGKSTLVDAVTGFLPGYAGEIRLAGEPIDRRSARSRVSLGVRRTFQHSRAIEAVTVGEYLRLAQAASPGAALPGAALPGTAAGRFAAVSAFLGLPAPEVPVRLMDAGSRRVLEIAGALLANPQVVLLDEPAAGMDEGESLALAERVREIPERFGAAVLLIEHDMGFVRRAASRATALDEGRVIAGGPTGAVLADPRVVAAYLGQEVAS